MRTVPTSTLEVHRPDASYVYLYAGQADAAFVDDLRRVLNARGFEVRLDQEGLSGDDPRTVASRLEGANSLIFVVSSSSLDGETGLAVLDQARRLSVPLVLVLREDACRERLPLDLQSQTLISITPTGDFYNAIDTDLVPALQALTVEGDGKALVFISYSHRDGDFVRWLDRSLRQHGMNTWIDYAGIPPGAPDWQEEIGRGIEKADAVVFVISQHSVCSEPCKGELQAARQRNKRIITVNRDQTAYQLLPDEVSHVQWIEMWTDFGELKSRLEQLTGAVSMDLAWVRQHTRWQQRAEEWHSTRERKRDQLIECGKRANPLSRFAAHNTWITNWRSARWAAGALPAGALLQEAEAWLKGESPKKTPAPTQVQRDYIRSGRWAARWQELRKSGVMAAIALLIAIAALVTFRQSKIEQANALAQQALTNLQFDPQQSVQMAAQAVQADHLWRVDDTSSVSALRESLSNSFLRATYSSSNRTIWSASFNPSGTEMVTAGGDGTARIYNLSGKLMHTLRLKGMTGPVWSAAFTHDGSQVVTGSNIPSGHKDKQGVWKGMVAWWNAATGKLIKSGALNPWPIGDGVTSVATSPVDGAVAIGTNGGLLSVLPTMDGTWHDLNVKAGNVAKVSFSRDGQSVLATDDVGHVFVWNWHTMTRPDTLVQLAVSRATTRRATKASKARTPVLVNDAAFSPDGQRVVVGYADNTARIWNWRSKTVLQTLRGHSNAVQSVSYSPDGKLIITGSLDSTARLWDAATGQLVHVLVGHLSSVWSAVFSHDGQSVATGSYDNTIRMWSVRTGQTVALLRGHTDGVSALAFSRKDRYLLSVSQDNTARLWDSGLPPLVRSLNGGGKMQSVDFSPNGKALVAATNTGDIHGHLRIWSTRTWSKLQDLYDPHYPHYEIFSAKYSPNGHYLVTAGQDEKGLNRVAVWSARTGRIVARSPASLFPYHTDSLNVSPTFSPDNTRILVFGSTQGRTGKANPVGVLAVWTWKQGTVVQAPFAVGQGHPTDLPQVGQVTDAQWSRNGNLVAVAAGNSASASTSGVVLVWDSRTNKLLKSILTRATLEDAVFSPDGSEVLAGGDDYTARVWVWRSPNPALDSPPPLIGDTNNVYSVAFNLNGAVAVTASADGTTRVWDWRTAQSLFQFGSHTDAVTDATFSPDSTLIADASADGTVHVYRCPLCGSADSLLKQAAARQP